VCAHIVSGRLRRLATHSNVALYSIIARRGECSMRVDGGRGRPTSKPWKGRGGCASTGPLSQRRSIQLAERRSRPPLLSTALYSPLLDCTAHRRGPVLCSGADVARPRQHRHRPWPCARPCGGGAAAARARQQQHQHQHGCRQGRRGDERCCTSPRAGRFRAGASRSPRRAPPQRVVLWPWSKVHGPWPMV
jgi:hypothetical protein